MNHISYKEICSKENLELAFKKARKGKTLKQYVINFENDLDNNLHKLRNELLMQTYKPKPLTTFILRDPKTRTISKADFRDRVIHHAICNIIEPLFEKTFIHDSYANRIGKGGLNAIKRFETFTRKASNNNSKTCFVLKADIKHYFQNVNHTILIDLLKRKIKDKEIIELINLVLENHESKFNGNGMPLGNLTSQFFANIYLNELDQYIKHELKEKYYIRYVDDFVIINKDKEKLNLFKEKINIFLKERLRLKLHPDKTRILNYKTGTSFLGFKIFPKHKILQQRNIRKFRIKLNKVKKLYEQERIEREKIIEVFEGHLAYAKNANTYKYRREITKKFNEYFPVNKEPIIASIKKHENFNQKIEETRFEFSTQKTHQLFKKGLNIQQIAKQRNIKEGTVWQHLATLIEFHQIKLKEIISNNKIKIILKNIKSPNDKLKTIKERIKDNNITYNEINCVLANIKGKHKKKSLTYFIQWYQQTNCKRKCHYNKQQREICKAKMQKLTAICNNLEFDKKEFLNFFNNQTNICELSNKGKNKFLSWQEFKNKKAININ